MFLVFFVSCKGQNLQQMKKNKNSIETAKIDTISRLMLRNNQYRNDNYEILHLSDINNGIKKIEITKNNSRSTAFTLPRTDNEIKNFSVSKITETSLGFKIVVDWGGGNNFYGRVFYFTFKGNQFYLDIIEMNSYTLESEKKSLTKKIMPQISVEKFDITKYLENE